MRAPVLMLLLLLSTTPSWASAPMPGGYPEAGASPMPLGDAEELAEQADDRMAQRQEQQELADADFTEDDYRPAVHESEDGVVLDFTDGSIEIELDEDPPQMSADDLEEIRQTVERDVIDLALNIKPPDHSRYSLDMDDDGEWTIFYYETGFTAEIEFDKRDGNTVADIEIEGDGYARVSFTIVIIWGSEQQVRLLWAWAGNEALVDTPNLSEGLIASPEGDDAPIATASPTPFQNPMADPSPVSNVPTPSTFESAGDIHPLPYVKVKIRLEEKSYQSLMRVLKTNTLQNGSGIDYSRLESALTEFKRKQQKSMDIYHERVEKYSAIQTEITVNNDENVEQPRVEAVPETEEIPRNTTSTAPPLVSPTTIRGTSNWLQEAFKAREKELLEDSTEINMERLRNKIYEALLLQGKTTLIKGGEKATDIMILLPAAE